MSFVTTTTYRLVKSEDLNHHGTLFAGRCSEWFVESGFIAVAQYINPVHIVCLNLHGLEFLSPVKPGDILKLTSSVVLCGKSTLMAYVVITDNKSNNITCDGFMTFCHVDEDTRPQIHGIVIVAETEEEKRLQAVALAIKNRDILKKK